MTRVLAALLALALVLPAAAAAQGSRTNAPPGNSAIDEYLETVPGAGGNAVPPPPAAGGGVPPAGGGDSLPAAQRQQLEQLGEDGKTLAGVVESTAPAPKRQRAAADVVSRPDAEGSSPIGAVIGVAEGDGGMGLLLPAILLATLLGVVALALLRRRSAS